MKNLTSLGLRVEDEILLILDQTRLPHEEIWTPVESIDHLVEIIKTLKVRGAPLIGVSAALGVALLTRDQDPNSSEVLLAIEKLNASRPTAVNLMWAMTKMRAACLSGDNLSDVAEGIFHQDVQLCEDMAKNGQAVIGEGDCVLTHCNTGGLATAGVGTALGVISRAHTLGKNIRVLVDETRPLLQGGRLTTYELSRLNIPYELICDNMAAHLMKEGRVQKVIVGSDRIAANGDFANKIGTYSLSVLCHFHKIPFYVAAPFSTVDMECVDGRGIPIEMRSSEEVRGWPLDQPWAPNNCPVVNPAFDVVPNELVSGWITERALYSRDDVVNKKVFAEQPL